MNVILKHIIFSLAFLCLNVNIGVLASSVYEYDEELTRARFEKMTNIVEMRYTSEVQVIIKKYLVNRRAISEEIVSKMMLYSPIFDYYFEKYGLPKQLIYLAIIESRLEPKARSHVGALGIWQLMAPTARELGLRIYHSVDERRDVYRSTDAACRYLKKLYNRFGDWTLAIAAYNTGQGRVSRILRESGGSTYWDIRELLPRETSIYVPAFIAATYVFSDFNAHGLIPSRKHPDQHFTSMVKIYNHKVYLKEVARLLKIPLDKLYKINPAFKKNYIPSSPRGYNLVVPTRTRLHLQYLVDTMAHEGDIRLSGIESFLNDELLETDSLYEIYAHTEYIVRKDESLEDISEMFGFQSSQIRYWNNLREEDIEEGMILDVPIPLVSRKFQMSDLVGYEKVEQLNLRQMGKFDPTSPLVRWILDRATQGLNKTTVDYHKQIREDQMEKMRLLPGVPIETMNLLLNKKVDLNQSTSTPLQSGSLLQISH